MFFYDKRVVYLSCVEDNVKVKSAGYIRIEIKDQLFVMDMHINVKGMAEQGKYEIAAESNEESVSIGMIYLQNGEGSFRGTFPVEKIGKGGYELAYENIREFKIILSEHTFISGDLPFVKLTEKNETKEVNSEIKASQDIRHTFVQSHNEDVRKKLEEVRLTPDKWQQLLKNYRQIHPYGDERLYISIEPKDIVIMSEEYQHLAHNSFLLHGFYNYRHIILGAEENVFYLGVPGVFYEREKMVAMMFGFEAFECEGGKAENGKFGYYLKKIKI